MKIDAIIVLGVDLGRKGEFESRLNKGIVLAEKYPEAKLVFSGGYSFRLPKDPGYREALLMKEKALEKGMPQERILTESSSKDTFGNAYFVRTNVIDKHNWKNLIVVPSPTNLNKARYYFDLVFGNDYEIQYVPSNNITYKGKIKEYESVTTRNLEKEKELIKDITPGDIKTIKEFLFTKHPAYANIPKEDWSSNIAKYDEKD